MREIGSFFWEYKVESNDSYLKIFNDNELNENSVYLSSGRDALKLLLKNLKDDKKIVILPGFTCETVILPFKYEGYEIHYYNIDKNLNINIDDFIYKINKFKPSIILMHSYFGFDTLKKIWKKFDEIDVSNIKIIEDITQVLYSNKNIHKVDYIVSSLRKWFAIPDGGALTSVRKKSFNENNLKMNKKVLDLSIKAFDLKGLYMKNKINDKNEFLETFNKAKDEYLNWNEIFSMSEESKNILKNIDRDYLIKSRRENYKYLLKKLGDNGIIEPIFKEINSDVVPLYFPVLINGYRDFIQRRLAKKNIYCPVVWPKSDLIKSDIDINTEYIYKNILCIPCDQRYGQKDMEIILDEINKIIKVIK